MKWAWFAVGVAALAGSACDVTTPPMAATAHFGFLMLILYKLFDLQDRLDRRGTDKRPAGEI